MPDATKQKSMTPWSYALRLLRLCLRPRRSLLGATVGMVIIFNAIELFFPKLLQLYIDTIAGNPLAIWGISLNFLKARAMLLIPLMLLAAAGLRWLVTYARAVYETRLGQGALFDLRSRIFNTMQNLSFAYHDASHSGTLISNVVEDVNYANMFFRRGFMLLIESVVYIVISYIIIFMVCPQAALAFLALLLVGLAVILIFFRFGHTIFARTKQLYARTVQVFTENMEGYLVVKGFGTTKTQQNKYNRLVDKLHDAQIRETILSAFLTHALAIIMIAGIPLVIGVALYEASQGRWEFSSGRLFMLFYLQTGLRSRAWGLTRALELTMRFTITAERLGHLLESEAYLADEGNCPIPDGQLNIKVDKVSFAYGDSGHSLHKISLTIEHGSTVGLVGPTGSGKSTLALLLCRFYDPATGSIRLNDHDIRCYPLADLRNSFSLVFQDTFLFSASIRDNIAYGRPEASFDEIVHAATIAGIHDHILTMPEGYETMIGERGVTLSGGQRQRISIARAILRKPRFLILDACTSALDAKTEKAIRASLEELRKTTTCVIIAHRISSVIDADRVYVMRQGHIVESGSPQDLNRPGTIFSEVMQP
jgi:ATP-binding cassette subfamily B protein